MSAENWTLYRFWNSDGELLYVGQTGNPINRISNHRAGKAWWDEVATITLERYADWPELIQAEADAIVSEQPKYNVIGRRKAARRDGPQEWRAYLAEVAEAEVAGEVDKESAQWARTFWEQKILAAGEPLDG